MTALVGSIVNSGLLAAASTATITTGSTTAGNTLVVWGWHEGITTAYTSITVTDGGNTWTNSPSQNTDNLRSQMSACAFALASGGARTITITFNGGTGGADGEYFAGEFSGGLSAFDQNGSTKAFTASPVTSTAGGADSGTDNLVVAAIGCGSGAANEAFSNPCTGGAAWTSAGINNNDASSSAGQASYRINAISTTDAATWSFAAGALVGGASASVWSIKTSGANTLIGQAVL